MLGIVVLLLLRHVLQALESHRGSILFGIVNIVAAIPVAGGYGLAVDLDGA